jgi:hypothetical protein
MFWVAFRGFAELAVTFGALCLDELLADVGSSLAQAFTPGKEDPIQIAGASAPKGAVRIESVRQPSRKRLG